MKINTHDKIDQELCGMPVMLEEDFCSINLNTSECMIVDKYDLVHGGFIFGAADYAAMLAVNDTNVVLGSANTKFLKPVIKGEIVELEARVMDSSSKKRLVSVVGKVNGEEVFLGDFTCFVLDKHILE